MYEEFIYYILYIFYLLYLDVRVLYT